MITNMEDSIVDQMSDTAQAAISLLATLEELITEPPGRSMPDLRHATHVGSSPSWHQQAAFAVLDIGQLARLTENMLQRCVGLPERHRGSSTHNTILALQALSGLSVAATDHAALDVCGMVQRWIGRARIIVGDVEPLRRLPRTVGEEEPRCPQCHFMTLRQQPYAGLLRCINPACRDQAGRRVVGRVEFGRLSAEPILVWDSGDVGLTVAAHD